VVEANCQLGQKTIIRPKECVAQTQAHFKFFTHVEVGANCQWGQKSLNWEWVAQVQAHSKLDTHAVSGANS